MRAGSVLCCLTAALIIANSTLSSQKSSSHRFLAYIGTYTNTDSKGIYTFRFDADDGHLTLVGLAAETVNPSFLALSPNNKFLYAVNEVDSFNGKPNNGGISSFSIDSSTGKLRLLNQQSTGGGSPCHLMVDATASRVLIANYNGGSVSAL